MIPGQKRLSRVIRHIHDEHRIYHTRVLCDAFNADFKKKEI